MSEIIKRIQSGRRVICHKQGPYDGKRGRVEDVIAAGEVLVVDFDDTTLTAPVDYFEEV